MPVVWAAMGVDFFTLRKPSVPHEVRAMDWPLLSVTWMWVLHKKRKFTSCTFSDLSFSCLILQSTEEQLRVLLKKLSDSSGIWTYTSDYKLNFSACAIQQESKKFQIHFKITLFLESLWLFSVSLLPLKDNSKSIFTYSYNRIFIIK